MRRTNCIVCDNRIDAIDTRAATWHTVDCRVCGQYVARDILLDDGLHPSVTKTMRYLLSAWIKWHPLKGLEPPTLSDDACKAAIDNAPLYTPTERMEQLLLSFALRLSLPGSHLVLNTEHDYPYAWARTPNECLTYHGWLRAAEYTEPAGGGIALSRKGWERATELQRTLQQSGRKAFVAMWFDNALDTAWTDGLQPGIREAGYEPYRIKEDIHNERIDMRIVAEIRACRFMVADVSGERTAVYYEAGLAEGLGKLVIRTCREDWVEKLSFDTRQFRHIVWKTTEQLRRDLTATIRALLPH